MICKRMLVSGITLFIFGLILCDGAIAAEATPLKVAYSAFTSTYLPLWVADEKGSFKAEGLNIDISYGRGGSSTSQALLASSIDVALIGGGPIEANLSGGDLVYIAAHVPTLVFSMFSAKDINRVDELKGHKIGTTAAASASEYAAILTLKRYGLDPRRDMQFVYSGGMDNTFASLSQGLIQAGVFSGPILIQAKKAGFRELVDIAALRIPFIHEGVAVRREFIKDHRDVLKKFLRGFVSGILTTRADKPLANRMLEKYLKLKERDVVEAAYNEMAPYFAAEPLVSKVAVENMLSVIADRLPQAKTATPERFYDNSILAELRNEGLFK
jgi:ABC-type nitrate/sulfonate/bicarbonate transport system substrate-binding protein